MVSNYDRILREIKKEAERLSPEQVDPAAVVDLAMEIVDLEDQHRTSNVPRIRQRIRDLILEIAGRQMTDGEQ